MSSTWNESTFWLWKCRQTSTRLLAIWSDTSNNRFVNGCKIKIELYNISLHKFYINITAKFCCSDIFATLTNFDLRQWANYSMFTDFIKRRPLPDGDQDGLALTFHSFLTVSSCWRLNWDFCYTSPWFWFFRRNNDQQHQSFHDSS